MEVLAPAGSMEHLMAALDAGADAIYLGGKHFSARKYAGNFSNDEIKDAVRMAHIKGSRVYITLNTLLSDRELGTLKDYVTFLGTVDIDGILVQDIGVASLIRKWEPAIPLHGSTQMTVSNLSGVHMLEELGFQRVVLSRELSLSEIQNIKKQSHIEIEVFVHGALCVCYSGQCLMSSFIGGRSGNRGACAQPCRMPYTLVDAVGRPMSQNKGKYLLSMKDMMGLNHVPALAKAQIDSIKIEGRMKSPEYVYDTVLAYREAVDQEICDKKAIESKLKRRFNRGYTTSFIDDHIGIHSVTEYAPGNHGTPVGYIGQKTKDGFAFALYTSIDFRQITGISFQTDRKEIAYVSINQMIVMDAQRGRVKTKEIPLAGGAVYAHFIEEKESFSMKDLHHKIPLSMTFVAIPGQSLSLICRDNSNHVVEIKSEYVAEKATKRITTEEEIRNQLCRLGETWFTLDKIDIQNESCMVPKSILNRMRQEAVEKIEQIRLEEAKIRIPKTERKTFSLSHDGGKKEGITELVAKTNQVSQVEQVLHAGIRHIIYGGESFTHERIRVEDYQRVYDMVKSCGGRIVFSLPRVVREKNEEKIYRFYENIIKLNPDALEVSYMGNFQWLQEKNINIPIECGASFNLFNSESVEVVKEWGATAAYISQEVTMPQLRDMVKRSKIPLGAIIYGRTEMMISEYCVINAVLANKPKESCPAPCLQHSYFLQSREGDRFPVKTDEWCHMHILNGRILDMRPELLHLKSIGVKRLLLDLRGIEGNVEALCRNHKDILFEQVAPPGRTDQTSQITRGHFFRGVL